MVNFPIMGTNRSKLSFNRAQVIDLAEGNSRFGYILGGSNREDLYRFKLGRRSSLEITLDLLKTNVNLQLFNSRQRLIGTSARQGAVSENLFADLKSGTYFLRVYTKSPRFTRYQLELVTDWAEGNSSNGDAGGNGFNSDEWNNTGDNNTSGWNDTGNGGNSDAGSDNNGSWDGLDEDWDIFDDPLVDPVSSVPPASIVLTSPNGGDTLVSGSRYAITWQSDTSNLIKIELLKGDSPLRTIAGVFNNGSYLWTVPTGLAPAADYRIKLSLASNSQVIDLSDQFFSIK